MYVQKSTVADLPRRRLSLRFNEKPNGDNLQTRALLPRNELRRIVVEMVG
jgi:hypothetical protein